MNDETDGTESDAYGSKVGNILKRGSTLIKRAEFNYLRLLRVASLALATVLLVGAAWFLGQGIFRQLGSSKIAPEAATIGGADVAPSAMTSPEASKKQIPSNLVPQKFANEAYAIYRQHFQKYQRPGDATPDQKAIQKVIWTEGLEARLAALDLSLLKTGTNGNSAVGSDPNQAMIDVIRAAATQEGMVRELKGYQKATKVRVCSDQVRTRSRTVTQWDSGATWCSDWSTYPYGCPGERTLDEPYLANVCEMRFPEDVETPLEQLGFAAERFVNIAEVRIEQSKNDAAEKASRVLARKAAGRNDIAQSGQIFLIFLALMFLYLIVVIERHYRAITGWFERSAPPDLE